MLTAIVILHILVSIVLVVTVLLQSGKGASLGSSFGGAGSQALFGSAGPTSLLTKITAACAIIFMITSVYITYNFSHRSEESVMGELPAVTAPADAQTEGAAPAEAEKVAPAPAEKMDPAPAEKMDEGGLKAAPGEEGTKE